MTSPLRVVWALLLTWLCIPTVAGAAGFYFGENGGRALSLGGAFVAQADDLSAVQHNPAGLTQLRGFHFLVDLSVLNHEVTFRRFEPSGAESNADLFRTVRNEGGLFLLPVLGLGYGLDLGGRPFNVSFGVYGPPSVGRYQFPQPNYARREDDPTRYQENPIGTSPQRYGLIQNDIIILYPSLSVAYEPHRLVSVGASLQYVYSHLMFQQAVTSSLFTPTRLRDEDPAFDSLVTVEQTGKPQVTGVLGVQFKPSDRLRFGASYRPPVKVNAEGTALVELGEVPRQIAQVEGDRATFTLTLPQELKVGVWGRPLPQLALSAEAVYQGWQSVGEFVLQPDIQLRQGSAEPEPLEAIHIPKKWNHAWGARFGAGWTFPFGLTARAGVLWEQSAIPDEYLHIDFLHLQRAFFTGGLEYDAGMMSVVLTGAFTPTQEKTLTESQVRQANTDPNIPGSIIGNGTYQSGGWILSAGVRGRFGAEGR